MSTPRPCVRAAAAVVAAVLVSSGCAGRGNAAAATQCEPTGAATNLETAGFDGLAGVYDLAIVATTGEHRGVTSRGGLTLRPAEGPLQRMAGFGGSATTPYFGFTDVDLAAVGAIEVGDADSDDPQRPGVLFIRQTGGSPAMTRSVTLRIGSTANDRNVTRFDGAYTALRVQRIADGAILGTWASGVEADRATGHFCARRVTT